MLLPSCFQLLVVDISDMISLTSKITSYLDSWTQNNVIWFVEKVHCIDRGALQQWETGRGASFSHCYLRGWLAGNKREKQSFYCMFKQLTRLWELWSNIFLPRILRIQFTACSKMALEWIPSVKWRSLFGYFNKDILSASSNWYLLLFYH